MQENTWRKSLDRTRRSAFGQILSFLGQSDLSPDYWDNLEAVLVQSDLGPQASQRVLADLRLFASKEGVIKREDLQSALQDLLIESIEPYQPVFADAGPTVILLAGVNGSGKTTTAARLGYRYQLQGKRVLFAAADTYRAAAVDQLQVWGDRLGIEVISGEPGSDPGAVVYSASEAAKSREAEILLIDTSGRMHTSHNLMAELEKVHRVCTRVISGAPHQTYLVIDATTGQNGLSQARFFTEQIGVDAVILAKLDGSARGGVGLAIVQELGLPIAYVGLGEKKEDLLDFNPTAYIKGLISSSRIENC
ncbi:MAG: signal recognition particle-docking protein FtsY [Anaerolineales bacterium]|nr:signal recognition particle-docking protein FtsY [Anaerolineales bacterium]